MTPEQRERYARHILLREVGGQGQQKLMDAQVLVVGAGGLGSPILQHLAASGVGTLGISDDDGVSLSNLQRQVIFRTDDVGRPKTESASEFIERLNPNVKTNTHPCIVEDNAREIAGPYDLVVEGVDNFAARYVLNRACMAEKIPLVSAAVGRFEGQLTTYKPFKDPGVLPCYRCLVPEEPPRDQQVNCAEEGVLGAVTGVLGALAAMETLKELLSVGTGLAGRLLLYDGLAGTFRTIRLPADPECPDCSAPEK